MRKVKLYKFFIYSDIAFIVIFIGLGLFMPALICALPLMLILLQILFEEFKSYITAPFRYLHRLFTKKLYHDHYRNMFETIVFGWFGNIAYFVFLFLVFSFFIAYRPYQDGYVLKNNEYNAGEVVIVELTSKEKVMGIIEETQSGHEKERMIKVSVNGNSMYADRNILSNINSTPVIRGYYITKDENLFIQIAKSGYGWIKNVISSFNMENNIK